MHTALVVGTIVCVIGIALVLYDLVYGSDWDEYLFSSIPREPKEAKLDTVEYWLAALLFPWIGLLFAWIAKIWFN